MQWQTVEVLNVVCCVGRVVSKYKKVGVLPIRIVWSNVSMANRSKTRSAFTWSTRNFPRFLVLGPSSHSIYWYNCQQHDQYHLFTSSPTIQLQFTQYMHLDYLVYLYGTLMINCLELANHTKALVAQTHSNTKWKFVSKFSFRIEAHIWCLQNTLKCNK